MTIYAEIGNRQTTPQSEPIPGKDMVVNAAGGYVFEIDNWSLLERFLVLGTEGGTYYTSERELTRDALSRVEKMITVDGPRVVETIASISEVGRAPRNTAAIWALAACSVLGDENTKRLANKALPRVCRIGTHLFLWADALKALNGHGPSGAGQRRALVKWYLKRDIKSLVYQLLKYQQREGWSHRDLLRLCKPGSYQVGGKEKISLAQNAAFGWVAKKEFDYNRDGLEQIVAYREIHTACGEEEPSKEDMVSAADLIVHHRLTREMVPSLLLKSHLIWHALLVDMPMTAMLRNLGKMSAVGLLKPLSRAESTVVERLSDKDRVSKSRLHPASILQAIKIYSSGKGLKGSLSWTATPAVLDALETAFELSFDNIEPINKRVYIAIDASGSMDWGACAGMAAILPVEGAAAMAMATARTENKYFIGGFHGRYVDLEITSKSTLADAMRNLAAGGCTDASIPFTHALDDKLEVDCFILYTDNETWVGSRHPVQALQKYREWSGIKSKLVVVSMTATNTSICDSDDTLQMDVCGFDSNAPSVISNFCR